MRNTKIFGYLAAVAIVMLLGAALVVPSFNAYATKGANDNKEDKKEKNEDKKEKKEQGDQKEDKKDQKHPDKCEPNKHGKYNKDCKEDQ